ncbi:TetR family transcriptional regulator [Streptomyces sp. TRM76323]|uniref:TetR family transcriptional regulator n=1 Tax=Streptomyces tamarix TaxID=3078565 RepID=A0ABU3QCM6_9ACTN|nr:TetR family transcriptional regulator [Streptomyces tamarix]MDT9680528.1 TetR family transcriptional regulator [Streptomyces tamarix]
MSHTIGGTGVRQARKQRTRQSLLDAALVLLEEQSLSSLGLREVTRAAGIAPTAFYRHFRDMADLGVALVEESLGSLHTTVRANLAATVDSEQRIAGAVELVARLVREHPAYVRFLARERHGGVRPVRDAIGGELDRFAVEAAAELARLPEASQWRRDDLLMLARLYVDLMVTTASALLAAGPDAAARERVEGEARRRLRLVALGSRHWLD